MHQHGTVDVDDVTRYIATGIGREQDGDAYQVVYLAVPAERDQLDQLGIPIARPLTEMDVMLMIRPILSGNCGIAAFEQRNALFRFTAMVLSQTFLGISAVLCRPNTAPALLTRMSTRPNIGLSPTEECGNLVGL